jgi:hypothetical protein
MLRVTEEDIVVVAEAVIDSTLIAVRIVDRRSNLDEVVRDVSGSRIVWHCRICLEELLHWSEDQRGRNFVARAPNRLILSVLSINRQRIASSVTPKWISRKAAAGRPG